MRRELEDLKRGVMLAEIGGTGDGPYCAKHAAGAALAVMGTYIVDAGDDVPYPSHFVFRPERATYLDYLKEHVTAARAGVENVAVSIITVELQHTLDFITAAEEAGADAVSLCAYSGMDMFLSHGLGCALTDSSNHSLLRQWVRAMVSAVRVPVIFKIDGSDADEASAALDTIAEEGGEAVHVASGAFGTPAGADLAATFASRCGFLIVGGGISTTPQARRLLDAGAGAVAVCSAAMRDPELLGRMQTELRAE